MKRDLRKDALEIFEAGLKAVDPVSAVRSKLTLHDNLLEIENKRFDLNKFSNIYVIGAGKATASIAFAIEELLENRITKGIINVKYGHTALLDKIKIIESGHPVPDNNGLEGTKEIIRLLEPSGENDLIFCLISGGGSALMPAPVQGIPLSDKQITTQLLLSCGADIHEINTIRKHISRIKGGNLARIAYPSTVITLILSDVVGDNLDAIASGPSAPDLTTFADCINILEKYGIKDKIPAAVSEYLIGGLNSKNPETPKPGNPIFEKVHNFIIANNFAALETAKTKAIALGYNCIVISSMVEGETKDVAKVHSAIIKEIKRSSNPISTPACVISGGETTVTIKGRGKGGRNQEFVLQAAIDIDGMDNVLVFSAGTDGTDGPTDAAGAMADGYTINRARKIGMDARKFLLENDSYNFFKPLRDLIFTGPTNTNVMDLCLLLVG